MADGFRDSLLTPGIVTRNDPPTVLSGMINVELDPQGRLTYFQAIPSQKVPQQNEPPQNGLQKKEEQQNGATGASVASTAPYDWNILFNAAGLDPSKLQPAQPVWNSLADSDTRAAWTGTWPGTTRPLRAEAASFQGKPVFFSLTGSWTKPDRMKTTEKDSIGKIILHIFGLLLLCSLLLGSGLLARRNYLRGRGDREGSLCLALVMFALEIGLFFFRSHFTTIGDFLGLSIIATATALFIGGVTWMLYMAVEPWVRRHWPQAIISWSRLLSGQGRDSLVGRDILFGVLLGVLWLLVFQIRSTPEMRMGAAPYLFSTEALMGGREALGAWLKQVPDSIQGTLIFFFVLFGLRVLLRKEWIAAIVFIAIFALPRALPNTYMAVELPTQIIVYAIAVLIVLRFGFVSLACAIFTVDLVANIPFSADFSNWYMTTSILALLSVVALAGWGFYHSLGGEPLWQRETDD